jgi:hypothetical protein
MTYLATAVNSSSYNYAAANSAQTAKTSAQAADAKSASSAGNIQDELTLSDQGRLEYAKYVNGLDAANSTTTGTQSKVKEIWTVDEDGNRGERLVSVQEMLQSIDYDSASPVQKNLIDSAKRIIAVHQWERANDFSFSSSPTTPADKKIYNDMLLKAMNDGVQPFNGFRSSLNKIEGTDWMIADGAEALIGHDVLGMFENANTKFNANAGQVNEYGFAISMPGSYAGASYQTTTLYTPPLYNVISGKYEQQPEVHVPLFGMDGGQTYSPEIQFRSALGLDGMSLGDRKLFLDSVQKILDDVMPGMDARQLQYSTGQRTEADVKNNTFSLTLDSAWLSNEQRNTIESALNQNRQLYEMKRRADASGNKALGEFSISVLDAQGNALAKDQIRLTADGKSVITSVDTIKDLNHSQIYDFIAKGILPNR